MLKLSLYVSSFSLQSMTFPYLTIFSESVHEEDADSAVPAQGRAPEAIACYEHVALLQPESAEAHANLASCYKDAARQDTAIASYRRALQLRPDFPEAFANLVHSLQCVCEWRDRPALFQRMEAEVCVSYSVWHQPSMSNKLCTFPERPLCIAFLLPGCPND